MTASDVAADHVPMARPRSSFGKAPVIRARLPGMSMAAPNPCTARAAMSCDGSGAAPHQSEPAAKRTMPKAKTRRRPR